MKRTTNIERLKSILRCNTDVSYHATLGIADDDFYIYLTNGKKYLVKEGYSIDWSDHENVSIEERSINHKKNMQNKIDKSDGFLDGVGNFLGGIIESIGDSYLSDKVDIGWNEIREIQRV